MKKINKYISLGYAPDGKRIRKWIHADNMTDYNRQLFELKKEFEAIRNPSEATFREYSEQWLATYKSNKSLNTRNMYRHALDKCETLGVFQIRSITRMQLQGIINGCADRPRTAQQIALTLKQIFKSAVRDGIIAVNPAEDLELPIYKAKEKKALTKAQRALIRSVNLKEMDRIFLDLLYYCGLRRGEALALTASDFDFKAFSLRVSKSLAFDGNKSMLKDTKTHTARCVPIPPQIAGRLKSYIKKKPFALFTCENGSLMTPSAYRRMWERIQNQVNAAAGGDDIFKAFIITPPPTFKSIKK